MPVVHLVYAGPDPKTGKPRLCKDCGNSIAVGEECVKVHIRAAKGKYESSYYHRTCKVPKVD